MRGFAAIGLVNPKTEGNIGGAMRAVGCYEGRLIVIQGQRYKKMREDTQKAWRHIPLLHCDLLDAVPQECEVVVVELVEGAKPLTTFRHPERAFYIFGPEDGSVPKDIIERAKHVVQVPTKHCMNLAATVNVVLYDRMAKLTASAIGSTSNN